MITLTDDDIRSAVSHNAYDSGFEYHLEDRVKRLRVRHDPMTIEAEVEGNAKRPYQVSIRFGHNPRTNRSVVVGRCTCPVQTNCKHVAATLFAVEEEQDEGTLDLSSAPAPAVVAPPPELTAWLDSLGAALETASEAYPPNIRKRLHYVVQPNGSVPGVSVELVSIELSKDGRQVGFPRQHVLYQFTPRSTLPKFLRPSDHAIIRRLLAFGSEADAGGETFETLRRIVATGRGRWGAADGAVLQLGDPVPASLTWRTELNATQHPALALPDGMVLLRLAEPWYADPATGRIGPLALDLPAGVVRAVLAAPAVDAEMAGHVKAELARRLPGLSLPVPVELAPPRQLGGAPIPMLRLGMTRLPDRMMHGQRAPAGPDPAGTPMPSAHLSFGYGPVTIPGFRHTPGVLVQDGQPYRLTRDGKAEAAAMSRIAELGLRRLGSFIFGFMSSELKEVLVFTEEDPSAWIDFVLEGVPKLRSEGWRVDIDDAFPLRIVRPSGDITARISEGSGIDWFDLELDAMVDGHRIDLLPMLGRMMDALASAGKLEDDAPMLVTLPDGRLLALPAERLRPFLATIVELFNDGDFASTGGAVRLSRKRVTDLALMETEGASAGIVFEGGEALRALGRKLRDTSGIPRASLPEQFAGTLRPYQASGVDWLQFLREAGLGGVLADDMGLGKTVQTMAHLAIEHASGRLDRPALVVCPTSLVANWREEARRFVPDLRVLALHGPDRAALFGQIADAQLVITTYPLLTRDEKALLAQEWHVVVLDEAQVIKNPAANVSKLAGALRARQRLCLTGTPLENHLGELWSLFSFLMPGFLGDSRAFGRQYRQPIERNGDLVRRASLARRVSPFLLRRTKQDVATDLPAKTEIVEPIELEQAQRDVYESIRLTMHAKVKAAVAERGLASSGIIILDALLKLRQACCDPRLLKLTTVKASRAKSAKLERLMEMLTELMQEGRSVLLFSQFTSMLALIEAELEKAGIPYVLLTGDTRDRATPVRRFQAGEVRLFLISLKAGGVGLNLTTADTVIHFDPWWNPAVENQATDRAHRIGQDKIVFVHRLITKGTIEEKMEALKSRKQALVDGILGDGKGRALAMTEDDIEALFAAA